MVSRDHSACAETMYCGRFRIGGARPGTGVAEHREDWPPSTPSDPLPSYPRCMSARCALPPPPTALGHASVCHNEFECVVGVLVVRVCKWQQAPRRNCKAVRRRRPWPSPPKPTRCVCVLVLALYRAWTKSRSHCAWCRVACRRCRHAFARCLVTVTAVCVRCWCARAECVAVNASPKFEIRIMNLCPPKFP